ncbi:MAG: alpha/beta hydrolase [Verrucomicrobiota bacterium]
MPAVENEAWERYLSGREADRFFELSDSGVSGEIYLPFEREYGLDNGLPVMMLIHGGGWTGGDRSLMRQLAAYFSSRGLICINVSYPLAGKEGNTIEDCMEGVRAAGDWVRGEGLRRGWDLESFVVFGESAGGHLALSLGGESGVSRYVLANPVLNLSELLWVKNIPGVEGGERELSPMLWMNSDLPPTLIIHGSEDRTVPFKQVSDYKARADELGLDLELVRLEGAPHAFMLGSRIEPERLRGLLDRIYQFISN